MSAEIKVPVIRFNGFSEEWEEKALGDVTNVYDGTHQTPKYTSLGVMFLSVENIKTLKSEKFISKNSFEKEFKVFPKKNDVLMTRIGDVGTANVVESDAPKAYYVTLALLKYKELDPYFLKNSIGSNKVRKDIWHRTLHIAFPKKINMNEIVKVMIPKPTEEGEQTKIGNYFQQLDTLIAQHQKKHNKLLNLKKALLEKMFPKQDATVPEIRFKVVSGEWEEKVLGELGSVAMNKRIFKAQTFNEGDVPFFKIGTFGGQADAFISRKLFDEYKSKYPFPERGDLLISASGSIGRVVEYAGDDQYFQDSNIVWLKHGGEVDNSFLKVFYTIVKWSGLEGSTIKRLYNKNILETAISLPRPEEQTKIGDFFKQLDTLLNQHQAQLKKLNNIKQACLEKMFV